RGRGRGLRGERQLRRTGRRDGDRTGRGANEHPRAEVQRPIPGGAGDGQVEEGRHAAGVGGRRDRAAQRAAEAEGWMVIASCVAAPGVRAIVFDVAPVSDGTLKPSVKLPGVPVIESPANVATPRALVTTLVAPPSVPPAPVAITAVTVKPAWLTAFPAASRSWSTGCCANTIPFAGAAEGCVVSVSCGVPDAVTVTALDVAPMSTPELKFSVRSPAVPVMARLKKVAT